MKNKFILRGIVALLAVVALTGCNQEEANPCITEGRNPDIDLEETPITDSLKLPYTYEELETFNYAYGPNTGYETGDGVGLVDLRSATDGDTANFLQDGYNDPQTNTPISIKTRFLGVNTPESTAKMEPWGKKASRFVKEKLMSAQENADKVSADTGKKVHNIVLITDKDVHGDRETSGRWLAFVWYRPNTTSDFRCLNLELVEQAYSKNQLFVDSKVCDYRASFEAADAAASKCGYRVHGEDDSGFDYQNTTYETSLWRVVHDFETLGADDEEGTSGNRLHIAAQVVGIQGDSMFLRDISRDYENGQTDDDPLQVLYCYAGFNSGICSILQTVSPETQGVGVIVYFYARATKYNGNIQLTDLQNKTTGKLKFQVLFDEEDVERETGIAWEDVILDTDSIYVDPETIETKEDIAAYQYNWISTEVEIRAVSPMNDDGYDSRPKFLNSDADNTYWFRETINSGNPPSYTYYAKIKGTNVLFNLRCDSSLTPTVTPAFFDPNYKTENFNMQDCVGKVFHATGYVAAYFENFQLQLPNNYSMYNYIYAV